MRTKSNNLLVVPAYYRQVAGMLLSLILLVVAFPTSADAATANISLSALSGPPGTSVGIIGAGFPSREPGTIYFASTSVASFQSNKKGRLSTSFVVPQGHSGAVEVSADSGATRVVVTFTVTSGVQTTTTTIPITTTTTTTTGPPSKNAAFFPTLPPGAALPSGEECASRVRRSGWEPRPANYQANHTVPSSVSLPGYTPSDGGVDSRSRGLADRVDGKFTGTTDEIIQWASCKWGFDEDINRAVAVTETNWHQATLGDYTSDPTSCQTGYTSPCPQSFGLMQVKATTNRATFPSSRDATAFNVDYVLMQRRVCYEGWVDWISYWYPEAGYAAGDEWGCVGFHYSGVWKDVGSSNYTTAVRNHLDNKRWLQSGF